VLCLPNTSKLLAHQLINLGLRVSYADVLAAAKQGVCGTDAWVAAVHHRAKVTGSSSGMSELDVALSCMVSMFAIRLVSMPLFKCRGPFAQGTTMFIQACMCTCVLSLALDTTSGCCTTCNTFSSTVANIWACVSLQAETSISSMSSSAYSSSDALDIGCFKCKLEQQLSETAAASELEDALFLAATLTNTDAARVVCTAVLRSDCFRLLKADIQLSAEAVQQLMQTATARSLDDVLSYAAAQPAAEQVPAAAMLSMIRTALRNTLAAQNENERAWAAETLHVLCKAAALDDSAALGLLETTAQLLQQCRKSPAVLDVVMANAAVQGLGPDAVEQVMLQALQPNNSGSFTDAASPIVCSLTMLPGAQQLSAASLQRLLSAALPYSCGHIVSKLVRLPAVEQLSAAAVAGVLQLAVRTPSQAAELVVSDMVQPEIVPAAAELGSDTMVQLV
jgi:hypothetical protein